MANRLLRSFAVKIGAGLGTGISLTSPTRQVRRQVPQINPLLTRIEEIESRVTLVELTPPQQVGTSSEEIAALGTLVSSQSEDISSLRESMLRIEKRNAEQAEAFGQKVALVEQQLPAYIDSSVNAKMADLEQRLRGEFQEIHHKTVDAFVSTIENRVVGRIATIENSLVEQSQFIVSLREKTVKTDDNLQRLLVAVEKLCARAEAQAQVAIVPPAPAAPESPVAAPVPESFESHYQRALSREPQVPREAEPEPQLSFANGGHSSPPPRHVVKTVGVALLGLAFLGFRLFR